MSLSFVAASTQYATGAPTELLADTVGTIAMWCRPATRHDGTLFWIGDKDVNDQYFHLDVKSTGQIYARLYTAGALLINITSDAAVYAAGELLHVAIVQNATASVLYVNGVPIAATDAGAGKQFWLAKIGVQAVIDELAVGRHNGSTPAQYFNGIIHRPAYWSVVLTAPEIAQLAAGALPTDVRLAGLKRHWPLLEKTGTTASEMRPLENAISVLIDTNGPPLTSATVQVLADRVRIVLVGEAEGGDATFAANPTMTEMRDALEALVSGFGTISTIAVDDDMPSNMLLATAAQDCLDKTVTLIARPNYVLTFAAGAAAPTWTANLRIVRRDGLNRRSIS